jgi:hypothetical protein
VFVKTKHNIVDDGMSKQWKLEDTIIIAKNMGVVLWSYVCIVQKFFLLPPIANQYSVHAICTVQLDD